MIVRTGKNIKCLTKYILLGAIATVCIGCGATEEAEPEIEFVKEKEDIGYTTTTVSYGEVVQTAEVTCTYTATEYEELSFGVDERLVEQVLVKKGDIVTEGDLLAAVNVEDMEDTIRDVEYEIKHLNLELEHTKELKEFDLESAKTLYEQTDKKKKDKKEYNATVDELKEKYDDSIQDLKDSISLYEKRLTQHRSELSGGQLIAGISGEITYMAESMTGTYCKKDEMVITISDVESSYFIADDLTYSDMFVEGETYNLICYRDGTDVNVEVEVANRDQWESQMFFKPVNAEMPEQGEEGVFLIELGRKDNVCCVPSKAIHQAEDGTFVYVVENELLTMRYVETGLQGEEMTEIVSGLEQGETVALK